LTKFQKRLLLLVIYFPVLLLTSPAIAEKRVDDGVKYRWHPSWHGKLRGMIGYVDNFASGWHLNDDLDQKGKFMGWRKLGAGWVMNPEYSFNWPELQEKPSWKGGRVKWPESITSQLEAFHSVDIEVRFLFSIPPNIKRTMAGKKVVPTWHQNIYRYPVDAEIRKTWDRSAPPGWTFLDEWGRFVREFVRLSRAHGDYIGQWMLLTEMVKPSRFDERNAALVIQRGAEEIKKIDPNYFVSTDGVLGRRLETIRRLLVEGMRDIDALTLRTHDYTMPEALYLSDDRGPGNGIVGTLNSLYTLGKKWGIVDEMDGRTKVLITDNPWAQPGSRPRFLHDNPEWRERQADYWTRSLLLLLTTGFTVSVRGKYREQANNYWGYSNPSIGLDDVAVIDRVRALRRLYEEGRLNDILSTRGMRRGKEGERKFQGYLFDNLFRIFRKNPSRAGTFFDSFLKGRREDGKKPAYFASQLLMSLLAEATFLSPMHFEGTSMGLRFRDDRSGEMVTVLWDPSGGATVDISSPEEELEGYQRDGDRGIREGKIRPASGHIYHLSLSGNPIFIVGEVVEDEWAFVRDIEGTNVAVKGVYDIYEIRYRANRTLSGGFLEVTVPKTWSAPQVVDPLHPGYITIEPAQGVEVGRIMVEGEKVHVPIERMSNGQEVRIIYGDCRSVSHLFDCGEDEYGPVTLDFLKMQGNMNYYREAGCGFDREGVDRKRRWNYLSAPGGWGMTDNGFDSIYRDMAVSLGHPSWRFMVDVKSRERYQVRVYLNGPGSEDDQYGDQVVTVGSESRDSRRDRVFRDLRAGSNGKIVVNFRADRDNKSQRSLLLDHGNFRFSLPGDSLKDPGGGTGEKVGEVGKDEQVCYLYGLTIIPRGLGACPGSDAIVGRNVFHLRVRDADGKETSLELPIRVIDAEDP